MRRMFLSASSGSKSLDFLDSSPTANFSNETFCLFCMLGLKLMLDLLMVLVHLRADLDLNLFSLVDLEIVACQVGRAV